MSAEQVLLEARFDPRQRSLLGDLHEQELSDRMVSVRSVASTSTPSPRGAEAKAETVESFSA